MNSFKIIKNQKDLGVQITKTDGTPYTQAFISQMMISSSIPDHVISQLVLKYRFTSKEYWDHGIGPIINPYELVNYCLDKMGTNFRSVAESINVPETDLYKLKHITNISKFTEMFGYIRANSEFKPQVNTLEMHIESSMLVSGMSDHSKRIFNFIDHLKSTGQIESVADFAETCGFSRNMLYNMRNPNANQDITKDMIDMIYKKFPSLNLEWLFSGKSPMIKQKEGVSSPDIIKQLADLKHLYHRLEERID